MSRRSPSPTALQALVALALAASTSCAHAPVAGSPDRIVGALVLQGTEHPIAGARVTLRPLEPLDGRAVAGAAVATGSAVVDSAEFGAFVFDGLAAGDEVVPLRRGWAYEVRADADGFYSAVQRIEYDRGQHVLVLPIEVIEPETFTPEPVHALDPEALGSERGSLIDLVLQRLGR